MKKKIIAVILCSYSLFAQVDKGRVSLIFDDEKIDVPVTSISINKDENVRIGFRAEKNDSVHSKWISMELTLSKFSTDEDVSHFQSLRIQVQSSSKTNTQKKSFILNYEKGNIQVQLYNNGDVINWTAQNMVKFQMDIGDIKYDGNELKVTGTFSVDVNKFSQDNKIRAEAHIKDGKFEIVL